MSDNMNIQQTVGDNIRKFRQARGMTMEDLAARIYKGKSTISKYEKGSIAIDIATLVEIAIALEVHPSQLLMSSALADRLFTTKPPGKPMSPKFLC